MSNSLRRARPALASRAAPSSFVRGRCAAAVSAAVVVAAAAAAAAAG